MTKEELKELAHLIASEISAQPETLSISDFAKRQGLSPNFVREQLKKGLLPSIRQGKLLRVNMVAWRKELGGEI